MSKIKVDVEVPFDFCENCGMCAIDVERYDVTELGGLSTRYITKHTCEHFWVCANAVNLYVEDKKKKGE